MQLVDHCLRAHTVPKYYGPTCRAVLGKSIFCDSMFYR